jgi:hypothetical protein
MAEGDEITDVLRECESRLRTLAKQGRLTPDALQEFVQLSNTVTRAVERRGGTERRRDVRTPSQDRRDVS